MDDPKVDTIISLVSQNHRFTPKQWPVLEDHITPAPNSDCPQSSKKRDRKQQVLPPARKPFTRSANKAKETGFPIPNTKLSQSKKPVRESGSNSSAPPDSSVLVTQADLLSMKVWINDQIVSLRNTIIADIKQIISGTTEAVPREGAPSRKTPSREGVAKDNRVDSQVGQKDYESLSSDTSHSSSSEVQKGGEFNSNDAMWDEYGVAKSIAKDINSQSQHVSFYGLYF